MPAPASSVLLSSCWARSSRTHFAGAVTPVASCPVRRQARKSIRSATRTRTRRRWCSNGCEHGEQAGLPTHIVDRGIAVATGDIRTTPDCAGHRIDHGLPPPNAAATNLAPRLIPQGATASGWRVCAHSAIGAELDCLPSSEGWSRLGESNPGPAHYEEAGRRHLWVPTCDNRCSADAFGCISGTS